MSEKHDLAVLFSLLDSPIAEFVESEPFKKLEQETDVIRHIEPFGLPEIKILICCSELLAVQEWTEKYAEARKLYASGMDVRDLNPVDFIVTMNHVVEAVFPVHRHFRQTFLSRNKKPM